jgi:hypothetical protein
MPPKLNRSEIFQGLCADWQVGQRVARTTGDELGVVVEINGSCTTKVKWDGGATSYYHSTQPPGNVMLVEPTRTMEYRAIEYQIVQTANPTGFRWTVMFDSNTSKTGVSYSKRAASFDAARAIDRALTFSRSNG